MLNNMSFLLWYEYGCWPSKVCVVKLMKISVETVLNNIINIVIRENSNLKIHE